jgi:hypothetical protein
MRAVSRITQDMSPSHVIVATCLSAAELPVLQAFAKRMPGTQLTQTLDR